MKLKLAAKHGDWENELNKSISIFDTGTNQREDGLRKRAGLYDFYK